MIDQSCDDILDRLNTQRTLAIHHGLSDGRVYEQAADEIARLREENERLREDCGRLFHALEVALMCGLSPHDVSGSNMWGQSRETFQDLQQYRQFVTKSQPPT